MKDSYVKPTMDTEVVDIPVLASQGGSPVSGGEESPQGYTQPNFGLCC